MPSEKPSDVRIRSVDDTSDAANKKNSRIRKAVFWSVAFHVALVACLLSWYLPRRTRKTVSASVADAGSDMVASGTSPMSKSDSPTANPAELVPAEQIRNVLEARIEKYTEMPSEQKLSELEKNLRRLDSIASEASVQHVTEKITSSLGLDPNQYQPKADAPGGVFDFDSGQLFDVEKLPRESGGFRYEATMVDAEGRRMKVDMSAAEGETLHTTFQQMKKYPMAAGIYRSVVMPMMQKMINAERGIRAAASEAERMQDAK